MAKWFFMHAFLHISQSSTKHGSLGSHRSQVQVKALLMHKWQGVQKTKTYRAVNPPRLPMTSFVKKYS